MRKLLYIMFLLGLSAGSFAQTGEVYEAYEKYQQGQMEEARAIIDKAIEGEEAASQAVSWHLRGIVYKELFKKAKGAERDEMRKTGVSSLKKSIELDDAKEYSKNNLTGLKYLATSYFNDAVHAINARKLEDANNYYGLFKENMKQVDPGFDFKSKDIMFFNAMGGLSTEIFLSDRDKNEEYFERSLQYYQNVLDLDSEDWNSNYNSGILYYNEGVNIIKTSDPEADFTALGEIQDQSRKLFEKALPYMLTAHGLKPDREDAITALSGIYFSLHDVDNSAKYNDLLEKLKNGK